MLELIKEALAKEDLATLYAIYEDQNAPIERQTRQELEQLMSEMAIELFHQAVADKRKLDSQDKREQFVLRIIYEIVLGLYATGDTEHAMQELTLLVFVSKEGEFKEAMKMHLLALLLGVEYELFLEEFLGDETQEHFYISHFTDQAQRRLESELKVLEDYLASFKKLAK